MSGWVPYAVAAAAAVALGAGAVALVRRRARKRLRAVYRALRVRTNRFKLTSKARVRADLLKDDEVLAAIVAHVKETGCSLAEAEAKVRAYLDEIIPSFDLFTYYRIGLPVARLLLTLLYKLAIFRERLPDPKRLHRTSAALYVFNHRSNADYVLAAYALHDRVALAFAVGEWARVWPLESLFKAFGSYFIRRGFRERLYHEVLRRYVQLMTRRGVPQAVFLEGRLSRDGLLGPPKVGILDHIVQCARDPEFKKDIVFVPCALNFDRVLEDRALIAEAAGVRPEPPSWRRSLVRTLRILFRGSLRLALRRARKFGYAACHFGEPISLRALIAREGGAAPILDLPREQRLGKVDELARSLMRRIAELMPVTAVPLVALALVQAGFSADREDLVARVGALRERLERSGYRIVRGDKSDGETADYALLLLRERGAVRLDPDGVYRVPERERPLVLYYANTIVHEATRVAPRGKKGDRGRTAARSRPRRERRRAPQRGGPTELPCPRGTRRAEAVPG